MNEREFEARLRSAYRSAVDAAGPAPMPLYDSLSLVTQLASPTPGDAGRRRLIVLVAAALLAAAAIGTALAIGSGLLRPLPGPEPRPNLLSTVSTGMLYPNSFCDESLPDGVLLIAEHRDWTFYLYPGGRLIRQPAPDQHASEWMVRRVSAQGIERLIGSIEESGLHDCVTVIVPNASTGITARTNAGVVSFGLGRDAYRRSTEAEVEIGTRLAERLDGPDLGLRRSDFVDLEWEEFTAESWEVRTTAWDDRSYEFGQELDPGWRDLTLPDGSPITEIGSPVSPSSGGLNERCGIVGAEEATALMLMLRSSPEDEDHVWWIQDETGGMTARVEPLLPHVTGCQPVSSPAPAEPRTNLLPGLEACAFLPDGWLADGQTDDYGGGWAACESFASGWLYVSRHPVSGDQAREIAEHQFGAGVTAERVNGATIYINDCLEPGSGCGDAMAISADPYLIVISPDGYGSDLYELARLVLAQLPAR